METLRVAKVAKCLALCALMLTLVALLPAPHGIVSPNAEAVKRFRRYLVTIPPNSIVNLTGWQQTYVPLGLALFGRQPYILNFG
ncbi:Nuclear factor NF-kappa-B p100 subunit [Frankliniella fusca]|uniref:Nuclear factor NF-kappa-B p100 subunit n=1 Tax=Frankliniella fusca TaxID=407009 RepID=A0AAE1GRX0_9NEOP|nr:Nuclear factor NF-kappa-B p100 subunit [Frankliniella fusca]